MSNQAVGFAGLLAGGVLLTAAITGDSLTAVVTGKSSGPTGLGGDRTGSGATGGTATDAPDPTPDPDNTGGTVNFEGVKVAAWIEPALTYARQNGWTGHVTSGFRTLAEQTRIYNSGVRPAAKPGESNHEGDLFPKGAVDVTQAQQLSDILKGSPFASLLVWAGSKDPVHFSHPHNGGY